MPEALPNEVEQFVRKHMTGRVDAFHVERIDDQLVLCGTSPTFYVKQLAQEAARACAPRTKLVNRICVVSQ